MRVAGAAIRHRLNKGNAYEEEDESKWPVVRLNLRHTLWKDTVGGGRFCGELKRTPASRHRRSKGNVNEEEEAAVLRCSAAAADMVLHMLWCCRRCRAAGR